MSASNSVRSPLFTPDMLARAENALNAMSHNFQGWLDEEVQKVVAARQAAKAALWCDDSLDALLAAAHDVKGLGSTYDYPLTTSIAASLCRLIETPEGKEAGRAEPSLIDAHVDAIRASARDQIKSVDHPVGRALLSALEARVQALGVVSA